VKSKSVEQLLTNTKKILTKRSSRFGFPTTKKQHPFKKFLRLMATKWKDVAKKENGTLDHIEPVINYTLDCRFDYFYNEEDQVLNFIIFRLCNNTRV